MAVQYKAYPVAAALVVGLLYAAWTLLFGAARTQAESEILVRPPQALQSVYAGQLDRYMTNEIGAMLSSDALKTVAASVGGVSADQVAAASTAVATPGSDVVVVRVAGLGDAADARVNQQILQVYSKGLASRAQDSTSARSKKLTDQLATLKGQIDSLSQKIADETNQAMAKSKSTVPLDPSIVAPVEASERSLLISQYSNVQTQLFALQSAQDDGGAAAQVLQQATTVNLSKHVSMFTLGGVAAGGAALGLALALIQLRLRPTVSSWEEIERAMGGRPWVALDSRTPPGVLMPNPAVDSLTVWLSEQARRSDHVRMGIAQLPGQQQVTNLVDEATRKANHTGDGASFEHLPVTFGTSATHSSGLVVPYKRGKLRKAHLRGYVDRASHDTLVIVVEA